ncbi:MAG: FkbM family methyltransferase [Flavobacteriia bacterium]|nr:FkbM family methyltransferase [Flavobacteriia bacterium]
MKKFFLKILLKTSKLLNHIIQLGVKDGLKLFLLNPKKHKENKIRLKRTKYPFFIRGDSSDKLVVDQVFYYKDYDISLDFTPQTIIDCGANIGLASIFFKNKYPDSTVIALEPEPENFNLLMKNLSPYHGFYAEQKGVWSKACTLEIIAGEDELPWSFYVQPLTGHSHRTIEAIGMLDIIEKYKLESIDLLKLDIEGAEENLFESNLDAWLPMVKVIIIELHDRYRPLSSKTFFKALTAYDFSIYFKGENLIATQINKRC